MSVKGPTYEENMRRLEELVHQLEKGDISLEEGLTAFEEGVGLIRFAGSSWNGLPQGFRQ